MALILYPRNKNQIKSIPLITFERSFMSAVKDQWCTRTASLDSLQQSPTGLLRFKLIAWEIKCEALLNIQCSCIFCQKCSSCGFRR